MKPLLLAALLSQTACTRASVQPQDVELAGRISLTWDETLQQGRLAVLRYLPAPVPLPAERQGIPMDACDTVVPRTALDGVLTDTTVSAVCDGEPLLFSENATGFWAHRLTEQPPDGYTCEVTIDDEVVTLPPLPAAPDLHIRARRARWTPGDADEIRVVFPRAASQSTICRLSDDGSALVPQPGRGGFVTRHRYALPKLEGGRVSVTVTAGRWWSRAEQ